MSATINCPRCSGTVSATASFCPHCRRDLRYLADEPASVDKCRWDRQPDEYAARISSEQVRGMFNKTVEVDQASVGLLFDGGQFKGKLPAGRHIIKSLEERLRSIFSKDTTEVVLIDKGWFPVSVICTSILTADGHDLQAQCDLTIRLESESTFYENALKAKNIHRAADFVDLVKTPVEQTILQIAKGVELDSLLNPHYDLRQTLQRTLEEQLAPVLKDFGLQCRVPTAPRFHSRSRLEEMKVRGDMLKELRSTKLKREYERKVIERDRKWDDFQRELASEDTQRMLADARSEQEVAEVLKNLEAKTDSNDLFRKEAKEKEWYEYLQRSENRDWSQEDRARARAWFLEDTERERQTDIRRLEYEALVEETRNRNDLDDEERRRTLERYDEDLKRELEEENFRVKHRLQMQIYEFEYEQEVRKQKNDAARTDHVADARAKGEADGVTFDEGHRQGRLTLELSIEKKKKILELSATQAEIAMSVKARKAELEEQKTQSDYERVEAEKQAAHKRELEAADQKIKADREASQNEVNKLKTVGEMSDNALFTVASPQQAALLMEKLKQEMFVGMPADAIMAVQSGNSEAVANALAEKFKAAESGKEQLGEQMTMMKEMYDRLIDERKEGDTQARDQFKELMQVVQQVANAGLHTQRDVGVAAAGSDRPSSVDTLSHLANILQPKTAPVPQPAAAAAPPVPRHCHKCQTVVVADAVYCSKCGTQLS